MALPFFRYNPNTPIPNNPFYAPETFNLQGTLGPIVVGSGLNVDYATNTLSSTGGGGGAVAQVTGGTGISVSPTTGNVVVTNTGVTSLIAGAGISLNASSGAVTITATGGGGAGTVTNVATGAGLTGGPITTTGTIALATTAVTPASYTNANITVDSYGRITAASNGAVSGGTVTSVGTGTGLTGGTITTTGTIALANTAVTPGTYTFGTFTVDQQGRLTSASSNTPATGTVTNIATGTGLCGGPITSTGTIALCNTAVTPGNYTNASFTVDQQGRLTAASTGVTPVTAVSGTAPIAVSAGGTPNVSIASASTSALGAVQLTNALNNTSETLALTACAGACLQSQITALATTPGIEFAGTIDASTGFVASVTTIGTAAGYTVGAVLPAASATTVNTYVIVTTPGTMTPPGGSSTVAGDGDWFLVSQTSPGVYSWQFLNVGFDAPAATTSVAGIVCLSTNALAQAGTDTTTALTPAAAASAYIPNACITGKGVVLTGTGAGAPSALPAGADGCALIACAACPCGLTWASVTSGPATPTVLGTVFGKTNFANTLLGQFAGSVIQNAAGCTITAVGYCAATALATPSNGVTALGASALATSACSTFATALGDRAMCNAGATTENVAVGTLALSEVTGCYNTTLGSLSGYSLAAGNSNVLIGRNAACANTAGDRNVVIGADVTTSTLTTGCELVIGYDAGCNWLTGNSTKAIKPGAGIIDCANSCGTAGQVLMSNGSNAICWGTIGNATPTVAGIVLGCTVANYTALGCNALLVNTGAGNVAVGVCALASNTTSDRNTAVGDCALQLNTGVNNVAVGALSLSSNTTGGFNVALGRNALISTTTGCFNTVSGYNAGCLITTGSCNVAIGCGTQVASPTGDCQLAIGFSATCNWLTGDSSKNIQPGAGIKDCAASTGTAGQILSSTATGIKWRSGVVQQTATCTTAVTLSSEITARSLSNGDSLTVYNNNTIASATTIQVTATTLANYQTYPTQATAAVFTLPPQGSVTLILSDAVTNAWYIESYDTPEQVGTVVMKAVLSTSFALSTSYVKIPFNVGTFNPQGYFDTTTNRYQPQVAGYYQIAAQIYGDTNGWMIAQIRKNGFTEIFSEQTSSPNSEAVPVVGIVYLNGTSDYIEVWATSAAGATISSSTPATYFTASLINQTNTRVVGIDATASMTVTGGTIGNAPGILEVIPGVNGVTVATDFNPQNWFDATTGRFTPTIQGYYQVDAVVTSNASSRNLWGGFFKNGGVYGQAIATISGSIGDWQSAVYSAVVYMNGTTDYLRLGAGFQGGTTGFGLALGTNRMSISLVGANQAIPALPNTWINAGTVQSVGVSAVLGSGAAGTAPTFSPTTYNQVRYRQIGRKEWEVEVALLWTNGTNGAGWYAFTLPAGLQFDFTTPFQKPFTGFPDDAQSWMFYGLTNSYARASQSGASSYQQSTIIPYDATRYRVMLVGPNTNFWMDSYYSAGGAYSHSFKAGFTFTSL